MKEFLENPFVLRLVELAFEEDIGGGDHTSLLVLIKHRESKSIIVAKEDGVLAGIDLAEFIFKKIELLT